MQEFSTQTLAEDDIDAELLKRCGLECHIAFKKLYQRHYEAVIRLSYRYINDTHLIEDIANETMLTVWQKATTFKRESRVKTWILGIAVLKCREAQRRQMKHRAEAIPDTDTMSSAKYGSSSYSNVTKADVEKDIFNAMQSLSPEHRICVELAYVGGFSGAEIADITNCPLNTVKTRLHYGKKRLREYFEQQDGKIEFKDYVDDFSDRSGDHLP